VDLRAQFDEKFRQYPFRYVLQCTVAAITTMVFLSFLDLITYTGLVAALGATTFTIFTMPHRVSTRPRYVIGGYIAGCIAGSLVRALFGYPGGLLPIASVFALGAIAVGSATLLMVSTNSEHPPAAGVALGLVLQPWDHWTVLYLLGCVCFLSAVRFLLKRYLIDLL
jgi:CBS-domain-containing membrane protein